MLYEEIELPGRPSPENVRRLDLLPIPQIARMMSTGICIDRERLWSMSSRLESTKQDLRLKIVSYVPLDRLEDFVSDSEEIDDDLNVESSPQIATLLFDQLEIGKGERLKTTKSGKRISAGKKQLETLKRRHPIIPLILAYREVSKLKSMIKTVVDLARPEGDLWTIHTEIVSTRTATGRLASRRPNLQNIGAKSELGREFRSGFVPRPDKVLISSDFCVSPETRILTADLRWIRADCVQVGQELIGFDEDIANGRTGSKFRTAVAERTAIVKLPSVKVVTDQGTIIVSGRHPFSVRRKKTSGGDATRQWVNAEDLAVGDKMSFTCPPWEEDVTRDGGYLAGVLDGEGYVSCQMLGFGQRVDSPVYAEFIRQLENKGYKIGGHSYRFAKHSLTAKTGKTYAPVGRIFLRGLWNALRILGSCRPVRLVPKARNLWEGRRTWGKNTEVATVISIESVGERILSALQTSTNTYISNGFLSHNSQIELRLLAHGSQDTNMLRIFSDGGDIHTDTAMRAFSLPEDKVDKLLHRAPCKNCNFGICFGLGPLGLLDLMALTYATANKELPEEIDLDWCERFISTWFGLYPSARDYFNIQHYRARRYGIVWTPFGRVRRIPEMQSCHRRIQEAGLRQAGNMPIQGMAADVFKIAMARVERLLVAWRQAGVYVEALLPVHDELLIECDPKWADEIKDLVIMEMERALVDSTGVLQCRCPIVAEGKVMDRWLK